MCHFLKENRRKPLGKLQKIGNSLRQKSRTCVCLCNWLIRYSFLSYCIPTLYGLICLQLVFSMSPGLCPYLCIPSTQLQALAHRGMNCCCINDTNQTKWLRVRVINCDQVFSLKRGVMWAMKAIYRTWSLHQKQNWLHSLQGLMQNKTLGPIVEELRSSRWQLQSIKRSVGPYVSVQAASP